MVSAQDYLAGVEVARFEDVSSGLVRFDVQLVRDGEVVIERQVTADVRGRTGVTVLVTRDCRFVACPVDGGDPVATTCVGGRCVDPGCTDETPELCATVCEDSTACPAFDACAEAVCQGVACVAEPRPGACPAGMVCDPERGCVDPACGSCNDSNACTRDSCVDGLCTYEALDGSACGAGTCELDRCVVRTDLLRSASLPARANAAAVVGNFAAIGMMDIDTVQLFRRVEGVWERGSALSPGDANFGCGVAMRGDLLAVLACGAAQSVTLFRKTGDDYAFEARLALIDTSPPVDEAVPARSIAVDADRVAAGVVLQSGREAVVVWEHDGAAWEQLDTLDIGLAGFGRALDMEARIVVGAPSSEPGDDGVVTIFELGASGAEEIHRVAAPGLGTRVWATGPRNMRAIGVADGTATLYKIDEREDGTWGFSLLQTAPERAVFALGDSMFAVGQPAADVGGVAEAGLAELRYFGIRLWVREPFPTAMRRFGSTVATDGDSVLLAPFPMDSVATEVTFVEANELEASVAE